MSVRAWFTISALVIVALFAAVAIRLFAQPSPPEILVTAGDTRLDGDLESACWPDRDGDVRCREQERELETDQIIAGRGTMRFVSAFPAQPEDGLIDIASVPSGKIVLDERRWTRELDYDLEPDTYVLRVEARYPEDAWVAYYFPFRVTRSGS